MTSSKEELIQQIEVARKALNKSIDEKRQYGGCRNPCSRFLFLRFF